MVVNRDRQHDEASARHTPSEAGEGGELPRLFLMRVWPRPAAFRVVLREVGGGTPAQFASSVEVSCYLNALWNRQTRASDGCHPCAALPPADSRAMPTPAPTGIDKEKRRE